MFLCAFSVVSFNLSLFSLSWNTLWFGTFFIWTVLYCWLDLYLLFWSVFYYIFLYECLSIHNVVGSIYFYSKTNNRLADSTSIKNSVYMCIDDVMIAIPSIYVHVSILNELWITKNIWITNNIWMVKIFKAWKIWCVSAMLYNLWNKSRMWIEQKHLSIVMYCTQKTSRAIKAMWNAEGNFDLLSFFHHFHENYLKLSLYEFYIWTISSQTTKFPSVSCCCFFFFIFGMAIH